MTEWNNNSIIIIIIVPIFRNPKLCITEKVLKFAQRHLESVNQKSCGCVLVGSLVIDPGNSLHTY